MKRIAKVKRDWERRGRTINPDLGALDLQFDGRAKRDLEMWIGRKGEARGKNGEKGDPSLTFLPLGG